MNKYLYNVKQLQNRRRELRKNQTEAEKLLWEKLRNRRLLGFKFVRQFSMGPYIIDFYCPKARLGIELDGSSHSGTEIILYDEKRRKYLEQIPVELLRFWNSEVCENIATVLDRISEELELSQK